MLVKKLNNPGMLKTLQSSLNISGGKRNAKATGRQTVQESLAVGHSGKGRKAPKMGRNHLRDSMGL